MCPNVRMCPNSVQNCLNASLITVGLYDAEPVSVWIELISFLLFSVAKTEFCAPSPPIHGTFACFSECFSLFYKYAIYCIEAFYLPM